MRYGMAVLACCACLLGAGCEERDFRMGDDEAETRELGARGPELPMAQQEIHREQQEVLRQQQEVLRQQQELARMQQEQARLTQGTQPAQGAQPAQGTQPGALALQPGQHPIAPGQPGMIGQPAPGQPTQPMQPMQPAPGQPMPGQPGAMQEGVAQAPTDEKACPGDLEGLAVEVIDTANGGALVFTIAEPQVEQLRDRLEVFERLQREARSPEVPGAQPTARLGEPDALIHAGETVITEIPGGSRVEIRLDDRTQVAALRTELREHADALENGQCPLAFEVIS